MDGPIAAARKAALLCGFAAVVAAQGLYAVEALGGREAVFDGKPVVSGRHPLHLVHGSLGARTFRERGTTSCFDPEFQAGYAKTPVFDGGCRPAEFVLFFASLAFGREESPSLTAEAAAYKFGLVLVCLLVPFAFAFSARGVGSGIAGAVLAAAAGSLFWWTPACRTLFDDGEIDLLLSGLCAVATVGALTHYHRHPGPMSWLAVAFLAVAGWFSHPVVWAAAIPLVAGFYLSLAPRHGLAWHLGLFGAGVVGLVANLWWLPDWARFWWLRRSTSEALSTLPTAEEVAAANGWGDLLNLSATGWPLVAIGAIGAAIMLRTKARTAAWLFLGAAGGTILIARLGQLWPALATVRADRAAILAAALSLVPAAFALGAWWDRARIGIALTLAAAAVPLTIFFVSPSIPGLTLVRTPVERGLTADQASFVSAIREHTSPTARILLEGEPDATQPGWNWTSLLPSLTDRAFLGGLDSGACVEAMACAVPTVGDDDFAAVAKRLNVGWVVCRNDESAARWKRMPGTTELGRYRDGGESILLRLERKHSFFTRGAGTWERADRRRIVLTDVTPDATGFVSLSLHYQPGMRVSPPTVQIEAEKDPFDPTPMIRLRLAGPVTRVTIVWQNP